MKNKKKCIRGMVGPELGWWIIGLVVLALVVIAVYMSHAKGISLIDYLKSMLRFGR